MSKELDAFEELKRQVGNMPYTSYDNGLGNRTTFLIKDSAIFPIIENAIKEHELMKEIRRFDLAQVNKEHKALEIIKDKKVCVMWLKNGLSSYNSTTALYDLPILTEEEYELLRGVLL